jgi:hypothetical protein
MALTATTIAGNIDDFTNTLVLTSGTGFTANRYLLVDAEYMKVQTVNGALIGVFRGVKGTKAVAHKALADAVTGDPGDFPADRSTSRQHTGSYTYSVSGALTVASGLHKIAKVAAAVMTLANPTTAQEGIVMTIAALTTATSHTVTYTAGFADDTTSSDVATFGSVGDTLTLLAVDGKWFILANNSVSVA